MVYYKFTNRFRWFTTKEQTGLTGLLTDRHIGLDGLLTDLHTGLNGLLQSHKPVYLVY